METLVSKHGAVWYFKIEAKYGNTCRYDLGACVLVCSGHLCDMLQYQTKCSRGDKVKMEEPEGDLCYL